MTNYGTDYPMQEKSIIELRALWINRRKKKRLYYFMASYQFPWLMFVYCLML
ncbi:hypothetical protein RhiirC2_759372, partial [Rhizophagus irregularis]